ncbi:MAG TPA: GGDEF domain-containing protein [Clostridiaceae bacterium]
METASIKDTINEKLDKLEKNRYVNSESTIELGLEIYSLCVEANHETGMALASFCVGQAYLHMSKYEKAMGYLIDSINLSQRQGICDLQVLAYINIGNAYFDIGEYEKSLDYYNSAENLTKIFAHSNNYYKNISFEFYASKIYNNIGEIYRVLRCYEDAIIYYNLSLDIERKMNSQDTFGIVLSNLGYVEYHLGNYDKALEYLTESLTCLVNNDYKIGIVEAYGLFALIHEKKANYEESERYFSEAIDISSEISYIYGKIELLLDFSNFLENIGKREAAIDKVDEAYIISVDNKMYAKTLEICKRAISLYEQTNDINSANKYYMLYFENERKLEPLELENRARNLKTKVKLDSLEKENKTILEKSEVLRRKAEDLKESIEKISIISELGEKITTTLNLNEIYEMLYRSIQIIMQADTFGVGIYNGSSKAIEFPYLIENKVRTERDQVQFDNEASMSVRCLKDKKIIVMNDMNNEYLNYVDKVIYITDNKVNDVLKSAIYCPLIIDNNLIGVMTVQTYEENSFTKLIIEMIKALSSYAAIAINNAMKSMSLLVEVEQRRKFQIELQNINNKLIYLSENDGLTDIPNRRKFDTIITEEWNKALANKTSIALIIFDIDCFKQYNDNYGHTNGDSCLINISKELTQSLVKGYFAARYGGDEFVIVLPDTMLEDAIRYGENLRNNIEKLALIHEFSKVKEFVTIAVGVTSLVPTPQYTIIEFIRQADKALYKAKNKGRNQVIGVNYKSTRQKTV